MNHGNKASMLKALITGLSTDFLYFLSDTYLKNYGVSDKTVAKYADQEFCDVEVYLGIPFAKPPIGALNMEKPEIFDGAFDGPRDCTKHPPASHQHPMLVVADFWNGWRKAYYDEELLS